METSRREGEGRGREEGELAHWRGERMSGEHQYMEKTIKTQKKREVRPKR